MSTKTDRTRAEGYSGDPSALKSEDLLQEIRLLRELLYETVDSANPDASPSEKRRLLDAAARASGQLARLLRVQASLGGKSELAERIGQIADEIRVKITGQEDG